MQKINTEKLEVAHQNTILFLCTLHFLCIFAYIVVFLLACADKAFGIIGASGNQCKPPEPYLVCWNNIIKMPTKSTFFSTFECQTSCFKMFFLWFPIWKNKNRKQKPFLQGGWEERIVCARAHPECVEKAQRPLAFGLACSHTGNRCWPKIAMTYYKMHVRAQALTKLIFDW